MKNAYKILLISFLLFSIPLQARIPENLAGTDIFKDIDLGQITESNSSSQSKSTTPRSESDGPVESQTQTPQKPTILALSNVNLCFGAEAFITRVAQALYLNGDVIVIEKNQEGKDSTYFYKNIHEKEPPITYQEINPLALLMRLLFYQTPNTGSLVNFKVSQTFKIKNKIDGTIDIDKTINEWASLVAIAVKKTYEFEQNIKPIKPSCKIEDTKSFTDAKNALRCNVKIGKLSFENLLSNCILFAQHNDLGPWFVVRLLMAGTYEQFGHDQVLIFNFYKQLKTCLIKHFKNQQSIIDQLNAVTVPAQEDLPIHFTPGRSESTNAYQAMILSKQVQGNFEPLTYRIAKLTTKEIFPDCFETLLRNIILKLILQSDGSFNTNLLQPNFKTFFDTNSDMLMQQTQKAHNDWADLLVSKFAGKVLWKINDTYEIRNSLRNLFIVLNTIFDLQIPSLQTYENDTEQDSPETKIKLTEMYQALNQELGKKIKLSKTNEAIDEADEAIIEIKNIENIIDKDWEQINGILHSPTGAIGFYMQVKFHGELQKYFSNNNTICTPEQIKKFPYFAGAINPNTKELLGHHLMPHLATPLQGDFVETLLKKPLNNLMIKIIYSATAQHCKIDESVYFSLLEKLITTKDPFIYRIATITAIEAVKNTNVSVYNSGLMLFYELVKAPYPEVFEAALTAATNAVNNTDCWIQIYGLMLFYELVKAPYPEVFEAALTAATNAVNNTNPLTHSDGLRLFGALVTTLYEKAFEAATTAATNAVNNTCRSIQNHGLELFKALITAKQHQLVYDALKDFTPEQFLEFTRLQKLFNSLPKPKNYVET